MLALWKMLDALREDDFLEGMTTVESTLTKLSHAGGYVNFDGSCASTQAANGGPFRLFAKRRKK